MAAVAVALFLAGCATMTKEERAQRARRNALLWEAARACEKGLRTLQVDRVGEDGTLYYTLFQGYEADMPKFLDCYEEQRAQVNQLH